MTVSIRPEGWTIPDGYTFDNLGHCKACDAPMAWCTTKAGKRAPLNADGTSHFATCPDAQRFRKAR